MPEAGFKSNASMEAPSASFRHRVGRAPAASPQAAEPSPSRAELRQAGVAAVLEVDAAPVRRHHDHRRALLILERIEGEVVQEGHVHSLVDRARGLASAVPPDCQEGLLLSGQLALAPGDPEAASAIAGDRDDGLLLLLPQGPVLPRGAHVAARAVAGDRDERAALLREAPREEGARDPGRRRPWRFHRLVLLALVLCGAGGDAAEGQAVGQRLLADATSEGLMGGEAAVAMAAVRAHVALAVGLAAVIVLLLDAEEELRELAHGAAVADGCDRHAAV
mmetsp:Transcript_50513/g.156316  ORF Transcript_50513/g.156316 Transcript_50513/m.156316 type:complete len:278 (-) Transcript_50513:93-926(-)